MDCFRWISPQRLPERFDLRARGWRLAADGEPEAIDCARLIDALAVDPWAPLPPARRSRSLALGIADSRERAIWLARGFGEALGWDTGLDEIAARAARLLTPVWASVRHHGHLELDLGGRQHHVTGVGHREPRDRHRCPVGQQFAVRVVHAHDALVAERRLEQARLGREVPLHGAVQVEVVLREVGEHRDAHAGAVNPVQGQRMRGDLHGHGPVAGGDEAGQAGLQLGCLGRGARTGEGAKPLDIKQCYPAYTRESIAAEETGLTRLRMHIAASGELRGVSLVQSSGSARLDEASIAAVRRCQFKRPRATSQPKFKVEYNWRLEEGGVPAAPLGPEKPDRLRPPL